MKSRLAAILVLLALASMATAAPACAFSNVVRPPALTECVIDSMSSASVSPAPALRTPESTAILPVMHRPAVQLAASRAEESGSSARVLEREPLLLVLRI